jgi:hypothetical protein
MVSWTGLQAHGVQTMAETPGPETFELVAGVPHTDLLGLRQGWGVTFRGRAGRSCWFHTPIPTLALADHGAARLGEFYVSFEAQGTARVTRVDLWNGNQRIKVYDGLNLGGHHDYDPEQFVPELPLHATGLNVSTRVAFGASASQIVFLGAYARFVTG